MLEKPKNLPGTNTLAYSSNEDKRFIALTIRRKKEPLLTPNFKFVASHKKIAMVI
jgi:hypothetical protein